MQTYDYIVVGAGSAGAAVANRLSADPRNKVLLLEAGRASHPWSFIPVGSARLITNPAANWLYASEPEANTGGRRIPVPRGKLLGGSSAINGMAFVRGQSQDFDTWAQMGNQGWSYEEVLPFFKRMERYEGAGDDRFRGREGPLRVTNPEPRDPIFATLIKAAGEVGIPHNLDYNGASQEGIVMSQATIARGRRMSTARCYLDPIRKRRNLHIETGALTEALVLDGKRCTGVRYSIGGEVREAGAAREVVVVRRHDQLAATAGIVRYRPARAPARARHRGAPGPARGRREPARPLRAADKVACRQEGDHLQRPRPRSRHGASGVALCAVPQGVSGVGGCADARLCLLARRARGAGPVARVGPDADRARAQGPKDRQAIRLHLLRAPDAPGEQGPHPHHLGRSAPAAGDQLQLSVGAARCRADRARDPDRPRHHDGARDGASAG